MLLAKLLLTEWQVCMKAHAQLCIQAIHVYQFIMMNVCCAAGFIAYAGNWVGSGNTYLTLLSGASLVDDSVYPAAAPACESWPSTYMMAAAPQYFGNTEVVIRTTNATGMYVQL